MRTFYSGVVGAEPPQRLWRTNRAIIAFGLLLCLALSFGGAYLLGLLELVGPLH
jgi:hypothetical protein